MDDTAAASRAVPPRNQQKGRTSKGAATVTGGGFITLASTLVAMNGKVPVAGMVLVPGIERFMSEARSSIGGKASRLQPWRSNVDTKDPVERRQWRWRRGARNVPLSTRRCGGAEENNDGRDREKTAKTNACVLQCRILPG